MKLILLLSFFTSASAIASSSLNQAPSGHTFCVDYITLNPKTKYCLPFQNASDQMMNVKIVDQIGVEVSGVVPPKYILFDNGQDPSIANKDGHITVINQASNTTIYDGVIKESIGIICQSDSCKDWIISNPFSL